MSSYIDALDAHVFRWLTKLEVFFSSRQTSLSRRAFAAVILIVVLLTALVPFLSTGMWSPGDVDAACHLRYNQAWNDGDQSRNRLVNNRFFPMHWSNLASVLASLSGYCMWLFVSPHLKKNEALDRKRECACMQPLYSLNI